MNLKKIKDDASMANLVVGPGEKLDTDLTAFNKKLKSVDMTDADMKWISMQSFAECSNLESVKLPKNLVEIGSGAFSRCSKLKAIEFPASLQEIGVTAFVGCDSLTKVVIPSTVKYVKYEAFAVCESLKTVVIKSLDTVVHCTAFDDCPKLKNVQTPLGEVPVKILERLANGSSEIDWGKLKEFQNPDGTFKIKKSKRSKNGKLTDPDDIRTYASGLGEVALEELLGYMSGDTSYIEEGLEDGIPLTDFKDDILDNVSDKDIIEWYNDFRK